MRKNVDSIIRRNVLLKNKPELNQVESDFNNSIESPVFGESSDLVKDSKKRFFLKTLGTIGVGAFLFSLFSKKAQALVFGSAPVTSVVGSKDAANIRINPAKEEDSFPIGSTSGGTIALASANTWYAVPSSAPTVDYTLIASLENADGTVRFSFDNGGTPSATNGNIAPSHLAVKLGAGKILYFGSSTAGDDVNFTVIQKE